MKLGWLAKTAIPLMSFFVTIPAMAKETPAFPAGSVELSLEATGQNLSRADLVTIYVPITTYAETAAEARSANRAAISTLTNALVSKGIDASTISMLPANATLGFVGNEAFSGEAPQNETARMQRRTAHSTLQVRLTDAALLDRVRETLDGQNLTMSGVPRYSLKDDRSAKSLAVADALAKVRQDAEAYAAPLGLRIDRIVSISNHGDAANPFFDSEYVLRVMTGTHAPDSIDKNMVTTNARVRVKFVLVPR